MNTTPVTPDWIAALPGFNPAATYNHLTLAAVEWWHAADRGGMSSEINHHVHGPDGKTTRMIKITAAADGQYHWESSLIRLECEWYVRATGLAGSPGQAAADALAYQHPVRHLGFDDWFGGRKASLATWETRLGEEVVTVLEQRDGWWHWQRNVDLSRFTAIGITIFNQHLEGVCESPEQAMLAALDAPALLRAACRGHLADTQPRPEPQIIPFELQEAA